MYYAEPQRKQEFTNKFEHQVKIYQQFVNVLKDIIPVVTEYNGKVLNVKIVRACKAVASDMNISLDGREVAISVNYNTQHYKNAQGYMSKVDISRFTFSISVDENKRVYSKKSVETIQEEIKYFREQIAAIQKDICFDYDEEVKAYEEFKKLTEAYNKRFSNRLRRSIIINY